MSLYSISMCVQYTVSTKCIVSTITDYSPAETATHTTTLFSIRSSHENNAMTNNFMQTFVFSCSMGLRYQCDYLLCLFNRINSCLENLSLVVT